MHSGFRNLEEDPNNLFDDDIAVLKLNQSAVIGRYVSWFLCRANFVMMKKKCLRIRYFEEKEAKEIKRAKSEHLVIFLL